MVFLVDADLPRAVACVIIAAGHSAIDVRDIGLRSADDVVIARKAQEEQLCLISGDFGFADIRNYPPDRYHGLVVLDLPSDADTETICNIIASFLKNEAVLSKLSGRLAIVSASRIRLRPN